MLEEGTHVLKSHIQETHSYIAGYLAKKIPKKIGLCQKCRQQLVGTDLVDLERTRLIVARSYKPSLLVMPNSQFTKMFARCCHVMHVVLPRVCTKNPLFQILKKNLLNNCVDILNFSCAKHPKLIDIFLNLFIKFYVNTWIKNVNRILKGIDSRKMNVNDDVKKLAFKRYETYKGRKNKVKKLKNLQ